MKHPPRTPSLLVALALIVGACSADAKPEAKPEPPTVAVHTCRIEVAPAGDPLKVEGRADGDDEAVVLEAAWTEVCAKLPEADRGACKDEDKYEVMIAGAKGTLDGKPSYSKTVTLTARIATAEGRGESDKSKEEACATALAAACEAAGAKGECVAAGTHQKRGETSSTATQRVHAPS